jgi:hypothetical protein
VVVVAPPASGSRFLEKGIFDDTQILYGNPDQVFPMLSQLRTRLIRVNLRWGGPLGVATQRPRRATSPIDPAYDWSIYDRTVQYAAQYGIKVVFSIVNTPPWANRAAGVNVAPTTMTDLRNFARAAATRYSGRFIGPDGKGIARVSQWLVWNEPNNPVFLRPQWKRLAGGRFRIESAYQYARMCNAVVTGIKAVRPAGKVACGVTGPRGNNNPNELRSSTSPLAFMRAMKAFGARGFDAYAHHPYYGRPNETPSSPPPPGARGNAPTAVTLGNLPVLVREVTRLFGNKRIWITEYGYQTNPPDRVFGVSLVKQATYMRQAYTIARRHPRIDMFLWFLLRDEQRLDGWQSGLLRTNGARKPSYGAFRAL